MNKLDKKQWIWPKIYEINETDKSKNLQIFNWKDWNKGQDKQIDNQIQKMNEIKWIYK